MTYQLRCNQCGKTFHSIYRSAQCPQNHSGYTTTSFLGEVAEIAVGIAVGYVVGDVVADVAGAVLGSIFDW